MTAHTTNTLLTSHSVPAPRGAFEGLLTIARFNWPSYAVAIIVVLSGAAMFLLVSLATWIEAAMWCGLGLAVYWSVASLLASYVVYDRSRLLQWTWLKDRFERPPTTWVNLHAGHDESSEAIARLFGHDGRVFDFFDAKEMTEPSITRARSCALRRPDASSELVDFRHLPIESNALDAAFLLLTAHELRTHESRLAFFRELHRGLRPGGRVIVAEHLRDTANFLGFGPGFLHFHSRGAWHRVAKEAGFLIDETFGITPFVAVFNLRRPLL